jgi:hypothetical protein
MAAVTLAVLLSSARDALACSCVSSGPPCEAAWSVKAVFVGTVRAIEPIEGTANAPMFFHRRVTLDVDQGFINMPAKTVVVSTGSGGGDCGYRFTVGKRYLVYASDSEASGLVTGICSRTRPIEQADEDLKYLKAIPAATGGRVYGRILESRWDPADEHPVDYGPMEGIRVSVQGPTFQKDAVTDAHGRFEVLNLPVGKASVQVFAPFGFDARYLTREVDLRDARACGALDFQLMMRATVSGAVVDASGQPLAGIEVEAIAAELAGFDPPPYQYPVKTDARGIFQFEMLSPGSYVFGINITKPRYGGQRKGTSIFLPGVLKAGDATVIELSAGDEKNVSVIQMPKR